MSGDTSAETVKSLLEVPLEKPEPVLSEAALENLYSISHNIQVCLQKNLHYCKTKFKDFLHFCGFRGGKKKEKSKKKSLASKKKKNQNKKAKKKLKVY